MKERLWKELKKVNWMINIIMGAMAGFFVGFSGYEFIFYLKHSSDYILYSAPWYTGVILCGAMTAVIEIILLVIKLIICRVIRNEKEDSSLSEDR